ncbi:hypothetical protein [Heyndrickxia oleronia]|nr:hypothetical protein [Heyndrickxia oleronia]
MELKPNKKESSFSKIAKKFELDKSEFVKKIIEENQRKIQERKK